MARAPEHDFAFGDTNYGSGYTLGHKMQRFIFSIAILLCLQTISAAQQPTREQKVRADKAKVESEGFWIYNDFEKARAEAKKSGKPILVALRCIPCEECVKLDDDLVDSDPEIRPLLEKFVCVRIVGTNGLDLSTFQFDTDQSFAMFMLNADKTVYGRFGTRSHRTDWIGDVSLPGMARALEGALALHANYPANQAELKGKRGEPLEFEAPDKYPGLREKYTDQLNYEGDVVKSCIHCHQIGEARRDFYWGRSKPIPEKLLFPYPHPKAIGLVLDPRERALVKSVVEGSPAAQTGLLPGDTILKMAGQPLLSMADVQWVLNDIPAEGGKVDLLVSRGDQQLTYELKLVRDWRRADDISWRVAAWGMRRIATGGMRLESLTPEAAKELGIRAGMALKALSVGKFGPHAAAQKAGFLVDDVLIEFDGQSNFENETDLFAYVNSHRKHGDQVNVKLVRGGKTLALKLPIQE